MEKLKFKIPTDWSDIKISQYLEFVNLEKNKLEHLDLMIQIISIFCDIDPEDVEKVSLTQLNKVGDELMWISEKPMRNFYHSIEIDNVKYGFLPNLNEIKVGEWVDLENYMKSPLPNLHKLMAILYRPITKIDNGVNKYEIEEYNSKNNEERSKIFLNEMSIDVAYGAALFFLSFAEEYSKIMSVSLIQQMTEMVEEEMKISNTSAKEN